MITPSGVRMASATQSMVLCVTGMNSISKGSISTRRPGMTSRRVVESIRPASSRRFLDERKSEATSVDWDVQVAKDVGERADVIFVAVGEDDGFYERAVLLEVSDVGNDEVHAEELGFGEHHSSVDDDDVVTEPQRHHVHSKFAETT